MATKQELLDLNKQLDQAIKRKSRTDYSMHCQYVNKGWILENHLKLVCDKVEELIDRKNLKTF